MSGRTGRPRQIRPRRKRGREFTPKVRATIERLMYLPGMTARAIEAQLVVMANRGEIPEADVPSLRSIYRGIADIRITDDSDPWLVTDSAPEDARAILDVLADVIMLTDGAKSTFTKKEAEWVRRLRKLAPGATPQHVWLLAREYMRLEAGKVSETTPLDHYLAFMPWVNPNRFGSYAIAIRAGWVKEEPTGLWGIVDRLHDGLQGIPGRQQSIVDSNPVVQAWLTKWQTEPQAAEAAKRLQVLQEEKPELVQQIREEMERAKRSAAEYVNSWCKRGDLTFTEEDRKAWADIFAEVRRMLEAAGVEL